jgi:hypothetical protein
MFFGTPITMLGMGIGGGFLVWILHRLFGGNWSLMRSLAISMLFSLFFSTTLTSIIMGKSAKIGHEKMVQERFEHEQKMMDLMSTSNNASDKVDTDRLTQRPLDQEEVVSLLIREEMKQSYGEEAVKQMHQYRNQDKGDLTPNPRQWISFTGPSSILSAVLHGEFFDMHGGPWKEDKDAAFVRAGVTAPSWWPYTKKPWYSMSSEYDKQYDKNCYTYQGNENRQGVHIGTVGVTFVFYNSCNSTFYIFRGSVKDATNTG